jgi:3-oxoisoapionate kinase
MTSGPAYGFYGDDFTGATDTLAHLARAGHRAMLFLEPPTRERLAQAGTLDAIGVAGAARAMSPPVMREELLRVGARFAELGVRMLHYKVCSTFDSAPDVGSIGTAVDTLRGYFAHPLVPVVGGQPGLQRYCAFGNLFAAAPVGTAHEAPLFRIDRHPTMSRHPATPMTEADLRVHLGRQGLEGMASMDWRTYALPFDAFNTLLDQRLQSRPPAVLFDVLDDAQLARIGRVLVERSAEAPLLAVGASSVAQAWTMALPARPLGIQEYVLAKTAGPLFVLAGSLSPMTAAQIDAAHAYDKHEITLDPASGMPSPASLAQIERLLQSGRNVLAFTGRTAGDVSREGMARACAALVSAMVNAVPMQRIGIAGGDTSSFAVQALGAWGLSYLATLSPGVALCRVHADRAGLDGMEVMLKGGQMGQADLFDKLLGE